MTTQNTILSNPILQAWDTPHQTPPFDLIRPEHYVPAFTAAIEMAKQEVDQIKNNPAPATFENTIAALDRAGEALGRAAGLFFNILECDATPEMQEMANTIQPMVTRHYNELYLDDALFGRVREVYDRELATLTGEERMLLKLTYDAFESNGATLPADQKPLFQELSVKLSNLTLQFGQNALAATNAWQLHIEDASRLQGIPEGDLDIAAQKARDKGQEGYLFDLSFPSRRAVLTYADDRALRKEMYDHSCCIAYGGPYDNCDNIRQILACRQQIAHLLGYENYAQYVLHNRMAQNAEEVYKLLDELKKYSVPAARREVAALNDYAHTLGFDGELQPWDFQYYSEKQKDALFNLSAETLKPYFKLENVIEGVFSLATHLYNLRFVEVDNISVYHKDVKVYEVYHGERLMSVLYLDFHPRATKRSGAWMTTFREQWVDAAGHDVRPLVSLVMNFTPSTTKRPSLLSFDEVTTFLHEFGHALNGMLSDVHYASLSCTNSQHDFVELPSQLNENWAVEQEFLETFARHHQTGELIPMPYIEQLKKMRQYMAGYASARQLCFGYLDMNWHTTEFGEDMDVRAEEQRVFAPLSSLPIHPEACMCTAFNHIFSGGYAAGYYGYKWAEMLEADAFSLFKEKGVMNREVAARYLETILSKGGSKPAMEMFTDFRGRAPKLDALLDRDGLRKSEKICTFAP
ncbi:MAG: M3 family metallopeptidase [Bacteroidales bacterium]|nr:M3 family metallopeptidase [Bacteroidales bacterium]